MRASETWEKVTNTNSTLYGGKICLNYNSDGNSTKASFGDSSRYPAWVWVWVQWFRLVFWTILHRAVIKGSTKCVFVLMYLLLFFISWYEYKTNLRYVNFLILIKFKANIFQILQDARWRCSWRTPGQRASGRVWMIDFGCSYGRWQRAPALKHRQTPWSSHSRSQSRQFGRVFMLTTSPAMPAVPWNAAHASIESEHTNGQQQGCEIEYNWVRCGH